MKGDSRVFVVGDRGVVRFEDGQVWVFADKRWMHLDGRFATQLEDAFFHGKIGSDLRALAATLLQQPFEQTWQWPVPYGTALTLNSRGNGFDLWQQDAQSSSIEPGPKPIIHDQRSPT